MKRNLLIISLILICVCGYARTAEFIFYQDSVSCRVVDKNISTSFKSINGVLEYKGQIDSIKVVESPLLDTLAKHHFIIGNTKLSFKDGTQIINAKNYFYKELNSSISFKSGDCISAYRDDQQIGTIVIKIQDGEIEQKIKFETDSDTTYTGIDSQNFKFKVKNESNCIITDYKIHFPWDSEQDVDIDGNNCFNFTIKPEQAVKDGPITITYKIVNHNYYSVKPVTILTVKLIPPSIWDTLKERINYLYYIIIAVLVVLAICCLVYLYLKKFNIKIKTTDGKILRCSSKTGRPNKGDRANREGTFVTETGVVYQCEKDQKKKNRISSILSRIPCKDGDYFDVDPLNECNGQIFSVQNINGNSVKISLGMQVFQNGTHETNNNYIITVSNNEIISILYRLHNEDDSIQIDVKIKDVNPQVCDEIESSLNKDLQFKATDGNIYEIVNKKIARIYTADTSNANDKDIDVESQTHVPGPTEADSDLNKDLETLRKDYDTLKNKYDKQKQELEKYNDSLNKAKDTGKAEAERYYKKIICEQYISLSDYNELAKSLKRQTEKAVKEKQEVDKKIEEKNVEIQENKNIIFNLKEDFQKKTEELIKQNAANAKLKIVAKKKNMHYIFQIEETLSEISETFKDVYKDISNQQIKDGLIVPMIHGVSGLSTGILSWSEDFTVKVIEESEGFFGDDFLTMKEADVKEILAKKFISNIIKSDSFSKFIRLYQLSTVPFIRKQLIEAHLNVDVLNKLYYKLYSMVTDFGYTIICPKLFEEKYTEEKYQWFNATNLFTIITLPDEVKKHVKGSEIIIDVNQIGFNSIWANRKATAVTPDF